MTPSQRTLQLATFFLGLALVFDFYPLYQVIFYGLGAIALCILLLDCIWVLALPKLSITRVVDDNIPVREWVNVTLEVINKSNTQQHCLIHDLYDDTFVSQNLPQSITLTADQVVKIQYQIKAKHRGSHKLYGIEYLLKSPLSLWQLKRRINLTHDIKVQPNYKSVMDLALLGSENQISRTGIRQQRRRGEGTEFHQLREFQNGDPMRKIDWKAYSRIGKLMSKEFQDEQDQQLIFLLDTGRRMRHVDGDSNFLDETLNAMLLLGHVAAKQGDAVGFMAFGHDNKWCAPRKHKAMVKHLIDQCFDIQSGLSHSDYLQSAQRILELQKRRALIIVLTNTRDEDSDELEKAIVLLRKRHLVVVADLQESFISNTEKENIEDLESASTYLALQEYLILRKGMQRSLSSLGAIYLDCPPKSLPSTLVSSYQQIKHSGRL